MNLFGQRSVYTVLGAFTCIVAATIGMTQFDIKRVIAYSTMSQLGYMFFALGVSAYAAAMFHLVTHAFFKALLFLGAGSVIHGMSDEQDMRKMGGIWKMMPITYGFIWIGSLALAGIYPFAGYYSKDMVLESAWADHTWFGDLAYWFGIAAALITAFYSWRLIIMTFHGKPRADKEVMSHVHESPPIMTIPLAVLAFGAIFSGMLLYQGFVGSDKHHKEAAYIEQTSKPSEIVFNVAEDEIVRPEDTLSDISETASKKEAEKSEQLHEGEKTLHEQHAEHVQKAEGDHHEALTKGTFWKSSLFVLPENDTVEAAHHVPLWVKKLPLLMGILGIALAYLIYLYKPGLSGVIARLFKPLHSLFFNKWFFDELYNLLFVKPSFLLGKILWKGGDQNIVDRFGPDGSAYTTKFFANLFSRFQTGYIFQYAFMMMVGLVALISWFVFKDLQGF